MKATPGFLLAAVHLAACARGTPALRPAQASTESPTPPATSRKPHEIAIHGRVLTDDYLWLRNKNTPEVVSHLEAENAFAAAFGRPTAALQEALFKEMLARLRQDDDTPPVKEGSWRYYRRYEVGKQYPIHCRRGLAANAPEVVLLDLNEMARSQPFIDVPRMGVSNSGGLLAYLVDTAGFRQFTLRVKSLETNRLLPDAIERVDGFAWAGDDRTLFYVTEDPQTKRPNKLFRHVLGSKEDALVYEEKDEMFELDVDRTRDRAFIVVSSASRTTSEVRVIDASKPASAPRLIAPREHDHEYYVDHRAGTFYIRSNAGGARNFRLMTVPVADPRRARWVELIPARPDVLLGQVMLLRDHMVLFEWHHALPHVSIYDFKTKRTQELVQAEAVYDLGPHLDPFLTGTPLNREFDTSVLRLRYQSPTTPLQVLEWDLASGKKTIVKQTPVIGYDASRYETRRIDAVARDGTHVPISLVCAKGTQPDGSHPMLLAGYGAYGFVGPLGFSSERVSLLDRGFVWAYAHVRGGGDLGKTWHDQGRMKTKLNTFTDFIDCAEHLKNAGWAKKDALVISGRSAGGLLVGAATNMRPDLFRVVLASMPFVDVINTMLDETLPLTTNEFEEWGNPKKRDEFDYIVQYSPYDNVKRAAYPSMLVRTSYNDPDVMYWEPAKWVAKLREMNTGKNPVVLITNMQPAGHIGKSGRFDRLRDTAFDYAFVLSQLGLGR